MPNLIYPLVVETAQGQYLTLHPCPTTRDVEIRNFIKENWKNPNMEIPDDIDEAVNNMQNRNVHEITLLPSMTLPIANDIHDEIEGNTVTLVSSFQHTQMEVYLHKYTREKCLDKFVVSSRNGYASSEFHREAFMLIDSPIKREKTPEEKNYSQMAFNRYTKLISHFLDIAKDEATKAPDTSSKEPF